MIGTRRGSSWTINLIKTIKFSDVVRSHDTVQASVQ